jgi:hypothetical protein
MQGNRLYLFDEEEQMKDYILFLALFLYNPVIGNFTILTILSHMEC